MVTIVCDACGRKMKSKGTAGGYRKSMEVKINNIIFTVLIEAGIRFKYERGDGTDGYRTAHLCSGCREKYSTKIWNPEVTVEAY